MNRKFELDRIRQAVLKSAGNDKKEKVKLNFDCSPTDVELIGKLTQRALEMAREFGVKDFDPMLCAMDLTAIHCNGTPLKLLQLLMSSLDDFSHDVTGIGIHIDRETAKLRNGFKPRFAIERH